MRLPATRSPRKPLALLFAAALLALASGRVEAQVSPAWDHYLVYDVQPKPPLGVPLVLRDQFLTADHTTLFLDRFANPVRKVHAGVTYDIRRPELHYAWWTIDPKPFTIDVIARNQFGDQPIHVMEAAYLLNPANKNAPAGAPLPVANHYKCYLCSGASLTVPLVLTDQFQTRNSATLIPRYFCTPVEKRTPDGLIHPIVDPRQHYTVYEIELGSNGFPAVIADQFIQDLSVFLSRDRWLMVPTDKSFPPTETKPSTWGRVKQIYR